MSRRQTSSYLESTLTPAQQKRLERKTVRAQKQQKKNTSLPTNVVQMADRKPAKSIYPKTENQKKLLQALRSDQCEQIIVTGPAGTGKTFLTVSYAADLFNEGKIKKIIISRPAVGCGEKLGFLPGTLNEKMEAWLAESLNILRDRLGAGVVEIALKNGDIEICATEHIRGRSFSNAFILVTEAQNTTVDEMTSIVTRVGDDSKLILDGDTRQSDIKRENGLAWAIEMTKKHKGIADRSGMVEFTIDDVVRSGLCKEWVKAIWG